MMETCLLMAPFLKGLNCCLRGQSPPPTPLALGSQVELKQDTLSHSCSTFGLPETFQCSVLWPRCDTVNLMFHNCPPTCLCAGVDLLVDQPLTTESLMSLVELTRFETLTPRFSATVPPCWVEVQQEQQQRRHPQHLHQQHHGDAAQHTRTWKLQSDR